MITKNIKLLITLAFLIFTISDTSINTFASAKDVSNAQITKTFAQDTLNKIDNYQAQYFEIVKRNDVLIRWEDDKSLKKDQKELKKLYKNVRKQIKNKPYMEKYKDIEKRYKECDEVTTSGINEFAENNYKEVDALLNEVYKKVKTKISTEDFKKLTISERKWLKEVQNYKKVYESSGYGSIGTVIYYDYETDMRQFRTLLLMLYL